MKVTVNNKTDKPVNISKLAPLMPIQVLGVKQEIKVNVKDIESVMKKATEIGVTVTPMDGSLEVIVDNSQIIDTVISPDGETDTTLEVDGDDLIITDTVDDDLTDFIVEEIVEEPKTEVVEEKPKKKKATKKSVGKKSTLSKIIGNNKN